MEQARQRDAEMRREEERKVEQLRKQMYIAGQSASATDILFSRSEGSDTGSNGGKKSEKQKAFEEQKRRKARLKEERALRAEREKLSGKTEPGEGGDANEVAIADADSDIEVISDSFAGATTTPCASIAQPSAQAVKPEIEEEVEATDVVDRPLVTSSYPENVLVRAHSSVWGSWYECGSHRWGFACCQVLDRSARCLHAPAEPEGEEKRPRGEPRGKRRRRGGAAADGVPSVEHAPTDSASRRNADAAAGDKAGVADARLEANTGDAEEPPAPISVSADACG
eukprot:TRINITY_DN7694_c0_g1_i1.p1 TRINITY_DN7694_c0_g1~~TRINITY_DN7694_c0_g1_i1.p1  ORF type:complete len:283 (-),score=56.92 TRINITY_DN7694_c0_g1_i1:18-866(-)